MFEQSLPLLCNYYSKLFGVQIRIQGTSAYTNGKVITIPRMNLADNTVKRLTCAYIAHEAGHVRYTDFSILKDLNKSTRNLPLNFLINCVFNILEDSRIEKLMSSNYIGIYENFELLNNYHEKEWRNFMKEIKNKTSITMLMALIQYYVFQKYNLYKNSHKKAVSLFEECEKRFDRDYLQNLLSKCSALFNCNNSQDVMDLSKEIVNVLKNVELNEEELKEIYKDIKEHQSNYKELATNKNVALNNNKENALIHFMLQCKNDTDKCTAFSHTGNLIESLSIGKGSSSREDLGVILPGQCEAGDPDFIKQAEINYAFIKGLKQKVKAYVEYQKSSEYGKKINVKKAQRVPLGETSIYKTKEKEVGFNTNIQIMVDASSSMITTDGEEYTRSYNANVTALSIALALENIENINTMVNYFPGIKAEVDTALKFGEKAHFFASRFDQSPRGSTPLAQAMYHCLNELKDYNKKDRNIWIILTDGMPDSVKNVESAIAEAEARGIEIYGISIRSDMIKSLLKNSIVVKSAKDLLQNIYTYLNQLFDVKEYHQNAA